MDKNFAYVTCHCKTRRKLTEKADEGKNCECSRATSDGRPIEKFKSGSAILVKK